MHAHVGYFTCRGVAQVFLKLLTPFVSHAVLLAWPRVAQMFLTLIALFVCYVLILAWTHDAQVFLTLLALFVCHVVMLACTHDAQVFLTLPAAFVSHVVPLTWYHVAQVFLLLTVLFVSFSLRSFSLCSSFVFIFVCFFIYCYHVVPTIKRHFDGRPPQKSSKGARLNIQQDAPNLEGEALTTLHFYPP